MSFFGGDLSMAHFCAHYWEDRREYNASMDACGKEYSKHGKSPKWFKLCEARTEAHTKMKVEYRAKQAKAKELGYKTKYFQFKIADETGKARAKTECESFAKEWSKKLGFELQVSEGCFL